MVHPQREIQLAKTDPEIWNLKESQAILKVAQIVTVRDGEVALSS